MGNSLFVIHPYNTMPNGRGSWVFDDEARDLKAEPFVMGIPEMINHFTKDIKNATKGFTLIFSATPIPKAEAHLQLIRKEGQGTWYRLMGTSFEGWLCPALYKYFKNPPKNIYCKFEALQK